MGCFVACFGLSKKSRKRRLKRSKQRNGSYEPLVSSVSQNLNTTEKENPLGSDSEFRVNPKNQLRSLIRKKVSFNLNVQVFEPVSGDYHILESETEEEQKNDEETGREFVYPSASEGQHNYRYQNCIDDYDEEVAYGESDLEDENDDEGANYDEDDNMPLTLDGESKPLKSNQSEIVDSVLKPVENLIQLKAVKAKAAAQLKSQMKENIATGKEPLMPFSTKPNFKSKECEPQTQDVAVDASLSSWLVTPNSKQVLSVANNGSLKVENISCKNSSDILRRRENPHIFYVTDWGT